MKEDNSINIKPFVNIGNQRYDCRQPAFYNTIECEELITTLGKNTSIFLQEYHNYIEQQKKNSKFFLLYNESGWNTIMLYSYKLRYHKNCFHFPNTLKILTPFKSIITIYFSTIEPGTKLRPHFGDTDATYRIHLGLDIPSGLPECGIEVGGIQKEWQNGKTIIFNDAHFHTAWNLTSKSRTVLIIDIIKPEFETRRWYIIPKILGAMGIGRVLFPLKLMNILPGYALIILHIIATSAFIILLPLQRMLKYFYNEN